MRGRFAPSPTGDLHLGGALTALAAWLRVRCANGRFVVRMEDLDPPRVVAGSSDRILDDLEWLGLRWDEGPRVGGPHAPYFQSERREHYDAAIRQLEAMGLTYPCTCTRADIARASSAPHASEEGPRYPGTCRDLGGAKGDDRAAAVRLRIPDDAPDVANSVGDFVLRRADGVASYQLAVVVDDLDMQIDEVVRGDDLLSSTPRQLLLAQLLGKRAPAYVHLSMVLGPDGERLAKRHQSKFVGSTIAELRSEGWSSAEVLGALSYGLGLLSTPAGIDLTELCDRARAVGIRRFTSWKPSFVRPR